MYCACDYRLNNCATRKETSKSRTRGQDAVDELLPCDLSVLVLVDAPEEIHDAGLLVVHPAHVLLPPHVKVKVGELFELRMNQASYS